MTILNCAVIGVGYLGRFHAQKYHALPNVNLIAVCDKNQAVCDAVAQELQVPAIYDYTDLFGKVDAVSIATTTQHHFAIAEAFLKHGVHVLIEKPMTQTVEEADILVKLAKQKNLKLQVGHIERFNAAQLAVDKYLDQPLFIDSQRMAPFNLRGSDVNVILDVMIHDIDLVLSMVKSPIIHIDAHGAPVITKAIDIANVRIQFENRCVANITASRISSTSTRKTRIFQRSGYLSIDYHNKQCAVLTRGDTEIHPGVSSIHKQELLIDKGDALFEQIKAFVHCIITDTPPLVSGKDGRDALSTAEAITSLIQINLVDQHASA